MKFLDIGEISRRTGIPPSTLRYYEEIGLIAPVGRHGLRRQYGPETLTQLSFILLGKTAGFSLREITGIFDRRGRASLPRPALRRKADDLDRQIRRLATLRDTLRHVAECKAPSHLECPTFRRLLKASTRRGAARLGAKRNDRP